MASTDTDSAYGPTYKVLFAAAVVMLWAGFGWWATGISDKVGKLSSESIEYRLQIYDLRQKINEMEAGHVAQNKALSDLERQVYLLERGQR
jgi:hypothetical protein